MIAPALHTTARRDQDPDDMATDGREGRVVKDRAPQRSNVCSWSWVERLVQPNWSYRQRQM